MLVKIEFTQTVKYSKEVDLTYEGYEIVKDLFNDDVPMYVKKDGRLVSNPQYEILENIMSDENIIDWEDNFSDAFVEKI
ncbi:hypothetical protein CMT48_17100 [Elizabethkingia anophelis]|nr:hypothetical protein [Elizabethkingia anophelis]